MASNPHEETLTELRMLRAEYVAGMKTAVQAEDGFRFYQLIHQLDEVIATLQRQMSKG